MNEERGQILVIAVFLIMTFILLVGVVADVGNWFVHKRHLQTQVDAAALAAGNRFRDCFFDQTAANTAIKTTALEYAGDVTRNATSFNQQVRPVKNVHILLNSSSYWPDRTPLASPADPPVGGSEGDLGQPCSVGYLDVKATDDDTPSLFGLIPFAPDIKTHARVKFASVVDSRGTFPFGVPDLRPQRVRVFLTDQCNPGSPPLATYDLARSATPVNGQSSWTSLVGTDPAGNAATGPWNVTLSPGLLECGTDSNPSNKSSQAGLVVAISGSSAAPVCGQPLVVCYDKSVSGAAVRYIRSWTAGAEPNLWASGSPTTTFLPWVADASLIGAGCSPSAGFTTTNCTTAVSADIHFGDQAVLTKSFLRTGVVPTAVLTVDARVSGGSWQPLTYDPGTGRWVGGTLPLNTAGPLPIDIRWDWELRSPGTPSTVTWRGEACTDKKSSNPCQASGTFPTVLEAYRSSIDGSGPIGDILLRDSSGAIVDASQAGSLIAGSYVTAQLGSSLGDPNEVVTIRLDDPQQNQSLDCDPDNPGGADVEEISEGCPVVSSRSSPTAVHYTPNSLTDPNWYCSDQNTTHDSNWLNGQPRTPPWQCVRVGPGFTGNKIADGMAIRTKNPSAGTCTNADNWPNYGNGTPLDPTINKVDPRIIRIFVVPYGSLPAAGTGGNKTIPVLDFAQFYITDWGGQGSNYRDPCPPLAAEAAAGPRPPFGSISGHFMRFDSGPDSGDIPGDQICDLSPGTVRPCIAVLVE